MCRSIQTVSGCDLGIARTWAGRRARAEHDLSMSMSRSMSEGGARGGNHGSSNDGKI